ncbi:MAG: hypothetical protein MI741_23945 [Rhodospirillales bacterium]|nr:hypothetical protein [Rhodospirillales bacterium]
MSIRFKEILKRFLFIPALLIGIAAMAYAIKNKQPPEQVALQETSTAVRMIEARQTVAVPRALGYGVVQPQKTWEAVAEVSGKVVEFHPQLRKGAILEKDTVLLRIDPVDYELAIKQINASIRSTEARLRELDTSVKNTGALIEIEKRSLVLNETNLERKRKLLARGNASQATVDEEERAVLARRQSIQSLENTLNLIPAQRDELRADRARYQAQLATAERDLEQTIIAAPFDLRISEVRIEEAQFAQQGAILIEADGIDVAEISAQVPVEKVAILIEPGKAMPFDDGSFMDVVREVIDIEAIVRLGGSDMSAEWPARFARMSDTVDPQTRAIGVIVAVDDPYGSAIPGLRPPLTKNMYVEVELRGTPRSGRIVVPRHALHAGRVYVVTEENRLEIRDVEIELSQTNFAVVGRGLKDGERIIVSDPIPAIEGMLLTPVLDERAAEILAAEAMGTGGVR